MEKIETTQIDAVFDALSNGYSHISGKNLYKKIQKKRILTLPRKFLRCPACIPSCVLKPQVCERRCALEVGLANFLFLAFIFKFEFGTKI